MVHCDFYQRATSAGASHLPRSDVGITPRTVPNDPDGFDFTQISTGKFFTGLPKQAMEAHVETGHRNQVGGTGFTDHSDAIVGYQRQWLFD
jgi:hypothetical protein